MGAIWRPQSAERQRRGIRGPAPGVEPSWGAVLEHSGFDMTGVSPYFANDVFRTRDVVVFRKAKTIPVMISTTMQTGGWPGGQGVTWVDDPNNDTFLVTYSAGLAGGFLLWGSNETSDQFISVTQSQPTYRYATMAVGPWVISTTTFETYTYAPRHVGPLVANVYTPGNKLYFSARGYFTPENELGGSIPFVGRIIQAPNPTLNNNYLELESML
jgi:hypothetical protein